MSSTPSSSRPAVISSFMMRWRSGYSYWFPSSSTKLAHAASLGQYA